VECSLGDLNNDYGLGQTFDWVWLEGPSVAGTGAGDIGGLHPLLRTSTMGAGSSAAGSSLC
jgi:hypothetical protein